MANWTLRANRLQLIDPREGSFSFVETTSGRWRIAEEDRVVLFHGYGSDIVFSSLGTVREVDVRPIVEEFGLPLTDESGLTRQKYELHIHVVDWHPIEHAPKLGHFQYSLERVTNFGRPELHFRHRTRISDLDLETLLNGRVEWERTLFYGLLRNLPPVWREYLEFRAQAGSFVASTRVFNDMRERHAPSERISVLMSLLEEVALSPASLAAEVVELVRLGLDERVPEILVRGGDENSSYWNLTPLLNHAKHEIKQLESRWTQVAGDVVPLASPDIQQERKWLPHRW